MLIERGKKAGRNNHFFISLIAIDFRGAICEKLQTIKYTGRELWIYVNKLDPTEFYLTLKIGNQRFSRICKLVEKSIVFGNLIEVPFVSQSYSDGCFYSLTLSLKVCLFHSFCLIFKLIGM
jgi:hypothetical protein